jgi:hypothetical protein
MPQAHPPIQHLQLAVADHGQDIAQVVAQLVALAAARKAIPQLSEGAVWLRLSTEVLSRNVPSVSKPGLLKAMSRRLSV